MTFILIVIILLGGVGLYVLLYKNKTCDLCQINDACIHHVFNGAHADLCWKCFEQQQRNLQDYMRGFSEEDEKNQS
jgi:hypothetical protein